MAIKFNGVMGGTLATYHVVSKLSVDSASQIVSATLNSYATEEVFVQSGSIVWQQPVELPVHSIVNSTNIFDSVDSFLVTQEGSPVYGGTPTPTNTGLDLESCKLRKIQSLGYDCSSAIVHGFESDALGSLNKYPSKILDQSNLVASVLDSTLPGTVSNWTTPFWCADINGTWEFKAHTAPQIQKVGVDGKAAIVYNLTKNESLVKLVNLAESIEQVNSITWDSHATTEPLV